MSKIIFSRHAENQMILRGASKEEVIDCIRHGESNIAKHGRTSFRKNFQYNAKWTGQFYHIKQVMPVVKREHESIIVITVYAFYF